MKKPEYFSAFFIGPLAASFFMGSPIAIWIGIGSSIITFIIVFIARRLTKKTKQHYETSP